MYRNTVEFAVKGQYALFSDILTRPGGEKTSYHIPTYEALKGIMHSIFWKPTIIWIIDTVRVMNQIRFSRKGIRPLKYSGGNDLAYYTYLRRVHYQVRAHFEWNLNRPEFAYDRNENKYHNIAKRMIERGGRRDVFLGSRECQGYVEPCKFGDGIGFYDNEEVIPYGLMEHGLTYADEAYSEEDKCKMTLRLWKPMMRKGIIDFERPEECSIKRHIKNMSMKTFGDGSFSGLQEFSGGEIDELDE